MAAEIESAGLPPNATVVSRGHRDRCLDSDGVEASEEIESHSSLMSPMTFYRAAFEGRGWRYLATHDESDGSSVMNLTKDFEGWSATVAVSTTASGLSVLASASSC